MFCSGEGAEFSPDRCRRDVHAPAPDCRAEQRSRRRPTTANILNSVTSTHFCIHPGAEESVQFRSVLVTRSSPTLCDPLDCSPPGSSGHGILQAGILEWVANPSSIRSSQPGINLPNPGLPHLPSEPPGKGILPGQILKLIRTRNSFLCLFHLFPSWNRNVCNYYLMY